MFRFFGWLVGAWLTIMTLVFLFMAWITGVAPWHLTPFMPVAGIMALFPATMIAADACSPPRGSR